MQRGDGNTCLHLAYYTENNDLVRLLKDLGVSEDIQNTYGETPAQLLELGEKRPYARFIGCRSVDALLTTVLQELNRFETKN